MEKVQRPDVSGLLFDSLTSCREVKVRSNPLKYCESRGINVISLKLLGETNAPAYQYLASEATKFLTAAVQLYKRDPVIRLKLSNDPIQGSMMLAELIRNNSEKKFFEGRIEEASETFKDVLINQLNGTHQAGPFTTPGGIMRVSPAPGAGVGGNFNNAPAIGVGVAQGMGVQFANNLGAGSIFVV